MKLAFWDISRAHFHSRLDRELFAEMPSGLCDRWEGDVMPKLKRRAGVGCKKNTTSGKSTTRATWPSMDINVATAVVLSSSCQDDDSRTSCHSDDFAKTAKMTH